ncbi:heme biosynthesis HemY N-terminal domain-containing protein [Tropicimonas sp. TH_r6]|uniref:heme biosynthesis protein HemY n=1 Tax=Tropicimonas sp. TH_r6 TaxID=3082085 RepID=UPI0029541746|nr:heme biosynthesis HemY N-terminal domain-containing protein [Tropicimonas sp. TH_r6]MDV7141072.1 heme biosynthesis HemY N-terminal domain-containing protein [Tropicimonas sp. TH_r6]
MLWSLIKILLIVAAVAALAVGAGYVMENGPSVVVSISGFKEVELGPLQAVLVVLALLAALYIAFKLVSLAIAFLRFLLGDETALSRYFDRNRERRGNRAMVDAMMALAAGEGRQAMTKAAKAEKLLDAPQVTNVITAQAAEMIGDRKVAEESYKKLLKDDQTRFVGIRGIMKQKLSEGDTDTALKLAEKAYALKPKHEEVQDTLLKLQAEHHDWTGARKTLGTKLRTGTMPRDVHRRRDAVLALSEAKDVLDAGKSIEAREAAIEANKLSPDLVPASIMAARGYIQKEKPRLATRVLRKTWESQPHPELAVAFAEIVPDEDPKARLKRFAELTKTQPDHPETKMLLAELNIAAEDFPAARRAIGDLASTDPTARSLSIMAAVERGSGAAEAVVRGWLAKAVTAPRGPQWVCDNCHNTEATWAPVCSNCGGFDTLSWKELPKSELSMPTGAEMLPLIVGQTPEAETVEAEEPAPTAEEASAAVEGDENEAEIVDATPVEPKP